MKNILLIFLFALSACVSYPTREEDKTPKNAFSDYLKDRAMDFRDIISVTGSFGFMGGVMQKMEVNPGELLDFILGIFLIDIYRDDIYLKGKKKCTW